MNELIFSSSYTVIVLHLNSYKTFCRGISVLAKDILVCLRGNMRGFVAIPDCSLNIATSSGYFKLCVKLESY